MRRRRRLLRLLLWLLLLLLPLFEQSLCARLPILLIALRGALPLWRRHWLWLIASKAPCQLSQVLGSPHARRSHIRKRGEGVG